MEATHIGGQGILGAAEGQAGAEGSRDTTLDPSPVSTGQNGHVNDAQQVVNLPPERLNGMQRAGGPRARNRFERIVIKHEAYEGFEFTAWVNYPKRLDIEIRSGDNDRQAAALTKIVTETNGWCDDDGNPYPPPTEIEFWIGENSISDELAAIMLTLIRLETQNIPNSLIETWRNTRRT